MKRPWLLLPILLIGLTLAQPGQAAKLAQRVGGTPTPTVTASPTTTPTPTPSLRLRAPLAGQALQGNFPIQGSTGRDNFSYAVLEFRYQHGSGETWFPLVEINAPVLDGLLAEWDTSMISDGIYVLRMTLVHLDGEHEQLEIPGLRVRNYTPIESDTPTPRLPSATPQPGDTPIPSPSPTPTQTRIPPTGTPLPLNPERLSPGQVWLSTGRGALLVLGLFALGLVYRLIKGFKRHST